MAVRKGLQLATHLWTVKARVRIWSGRLDITDHLLFRKSSRWHVRVIVFVGCRLLEPLLDLRKSKLGADHPDTLQSMNNLAVCLSEEG